MGTVTATEGVDFTLPAAPPLTDPPLCLLDLAIPFIDTEGLTENLRLARDAAARGSAETADMAAALQAVHDAARAILPDVDQSSDAQAALALATANWQQAYDAGVAADAMANDLSKQLAALERWEAGFRYLPELGNAEALEVFSVDSGTPGTDAALKSTAATQDPFLWYDPFEVVGHDKRSTFGFPFTDFKSRMDRATRGLRYHEGWQVEQEFWGGLKVPTNFHLSASPSTPLTSPHRTITAFPNPSAAPGTVLGTAVGLAQSLQALDQAIAEADAGTGMIHATPYLVQAWMRTFPYIRDPDGKVYTVNHNLLVPGYGYMGTGPDTANRTVTDGVLNSTTEITSATADFLAVNDLGRPVTGTGIPPGTYIASVVSTSEVLLSQAATASASSVHVTVVGQGGRIGGSPQQWAYATDMTYWCKGEIHQLPDGVNEMSPLILQNTMDVRAERADAIITNQLLRAAVYVDTTIA